MKTVSMKSSLTVETLKEIIKNEEKHYIDSLKSQLDELSNYNPDWVEDCIIGAAKKEKKSVQLLKISVKKYIDEILNITEILDEHYQETIASRFSEDSGFQFVTYREPDSLVIEFYVIWGRNDDLIFTSQ